MQKIVTNFWFDRQAEEAARFYTSIFPNSKIGAIAYYGDGAPLPKGTVLTVEFQLDGQDFIALNGGPEFQFTPATSFMITCENQAEVDYYWSKLTEGGAEEQCGWLRDKYGLSWQVVPAIINKLLLDGDQARVDSVMQALYQMRKIEIEPLLQAYEKVR
ncbi:MAG: VOC family protein [Anaerolineaceae bacterium]